MMFSSQTLLDVYKKAAILHRTTHTQDTSDFNILMCIIITLPPPPLQAFTRLFLGANNLKEC